MDKQLINKSDNITLKKGPLMFVLIQDEGLIAIETLKNILKPTV